MKPRWLTCLAAALLCACIERDEYHYPDQVPAESLSKPVLIIAHRGGMAYAPENTVAAFDNGLRLGVDVLEMDVQLLRDEFVVLHDFSLERTTDCELPSVAVDNEVRARCDAGYWWLPGSNSFSNGAGWPYFRSRGVRIPVLDEVLQLVAGTDQQLMIELKHKNGLAGTLSLSDTTDRLLSLIREKELGSKVMINASSSFVLARTEALVPEAITVLSWGNELKVPCVSTVFDAIERGFDGVSLQASQYGKPGFDVCAALARDAGLLLMFWTVNNPEEVKKLLPLRPDAILTDYPACLNALLYGTEISNPYPEVISEQQFLPKCG